MIAAFFISFIELVTDLNERKKVRRTKANERPTGVPPPPPPPPLPRASTRGLERCRKERVGQRVLLVSTSCVMNPREKNN